jgi:hypothetical protein
VILLLTIINIKITTTAKMMDTTATMTLSTSQLLFKNSNCEVQPSLNGSSQDEVLQNVQEEHGGSIDSSISPSC